MRTPAEHQVPLRGTADQRSPRRGPGSGGVTGKGFQPGQSGNPSGRPKAFGEFQALVQTHTAAAVTVLVKIMTTSRSDSARVAAATALLDRGWGRPHQSTSVQAEPAQAIYILPPGDEPPEAT
jgi:hypothetical protein